MQGDRVLLDRSNFKNFSQGINLFRAEYEGILNYFLIEKPLHRLLIAPQTKIHDENFEVSKKPHMFESSKHDIRYQIIFLVLEHLPKFAYFLTLKINRLREPLTVERIHFHYRI